MTKPKKMTFEGLCLAYALNAEQISNLYGANKEILDEMKRRKNYCLDKFKRGELQIEMTEEIQYEEGDGVSEQIRHDETASDTI